jgi:D-glycero-alpha-D-manno-heptose-7-phosphate kinase
MILLNKTPYRVSLFGGGSDYNLWLESNLGATISLSIKLYSNILIRTLSPVFGSTYRIRYFDREEAHSAVTVKHPIIRHALLRWLDRYPSMVDHRLDIIHSGDLPAMTGMGTSSCFTVGFVNALESFVGVTMSKYQLAKEAIFIEQVLNKESVGYQDQIAAAFGGVNFVEYFSPCSFQVRPVDVDTDWIATLVQSLKLVYTGLTRHANAVARDMLTNLGQNQHNISAIAMDAHRCYKIMTQSGDQCEIGHMLAETWERKKATSSQISNPDIDNLYNRLRLAGAVGGKLLGAGGGGFILVYVPLNQAEKFALSTRDLTVLPVEIDWHGSATSVVSGNF